MNRPTAILSVAQDFSRTPGARFVEDGQYSAEAFYTNHLYPAFLGVVEEGGHLFLDLDGVAGYATSFLQGTFGTLAHDFGTEVVRKHLTYKNEDDPRLNSLIERYITEAHKVEKSSA